jgi:hypothetical protein
MSWTEPKTDWSPTDGMLDTDMNAIGENAVTLHKGNGDTSCPIVNPTIQNELDIDSTHEVFIIADSTYALSLILTEDRQPGNTILIICSVSGVEIRSDGTPTGNYKSIVIEGETTKTAYTGAVIQLTYYNDAWYAGYFADAV